MNIGLLGLTFQAENKGCEALAYSFLELLNRIALKKNEMFEVQVISFVRPKRLMKKGWKKETESLLPVYQYSNLKIDVCFYRTLGKKILYFPRIEKCDFVFDFTAGDSFTDIYGKERFYARTLLKEDIINRKIPLILGSQTIGPFQDTEVRKTAIRVIQNCREVFVRDEISYQYTEQISGRKPILTTDVAFLLPFTKSGKTASKKKIGFDPSGLLWAGGYTQDNQFHLSVNYKEYCCQVIETLLADGNYEIHLISHVASQNRALVDNDLNAALELKDQYPDVIVVEPFSTAIDAKSYISGMDFFTGARMHATIAAISAGVPTVPFSYSRKFEGLYGSLNYPFIIQATHVSTDEAVAQTLQWITEAECLQQRISECKKIIQEKTNYLIDETRRVLYED